MQYIDDSLENKTILITGGAGFVGSNLAFYFQKHHPKARVIVFDSFRSGEMFPEGNLKSLGHFKNLLGFTGEVIAGDINSPQDLKRLEAYPLDYVFHEAAISDTTVMNQELMIRSNTNAFKDLLDLCVKKGASLIYASSAGTYGNTKAPNSVGANEVPENVYGFSKLMMDNLAYTYMREYPNLRIVGLRYFNVYGEREFHKGKTASMILQLGLQALEHQRVRLFKFGEQKRDFVYIKDVVQANVKAMKSQKSGVYNVGYGKARTYNDIVEALRVELGAFEVEYIDNPYRFFQNHTEANIAPTKQFLGYEPRFSLEAGVKSYVDEIKRIHEENKK
ncbi:MAG: ADP-glyceromanno-heptose 6-epimerase [Wolinella succinogenes]|uniref:ADP-glyceromanno-heptose 6-epimerase n=1 Tax=Wolinella succinogenes TaxID=844 RepID=UPI0016A97E90|nr:ADP-glyceromanno-heptose 6-epimerase [Wolinella succinogenes]NLU34922.1 ADP-glyceromanno-heptose 6-epimerase [Wolinella succinogenes]